MTRILIEIIVAIVLAVGGWFGGSLYTYDRVERLPPKTENNYTTQNVTTEQSSVTRVDQSQTTMILGANGSTNYRTVMVQGSGKTNTYTFQTSKTNITKKTN